jgi:hypothetical protein
MGSRLQHPKNAIEHATVVYTRNVSSIGLMAAHSWSLSLRLRFRSLNHVYDRTINLQRPSPSR